MKLTITENPEALSKRFQSLQKLKQANLKVGLPESAGGRLHFILAVQEHGSPVMRIPSRPVIRPALSRDETREAMADHLRSAVQAAWEGDGAAATKEQIAASGRSARQTVSSKKVGEVAISYSTESLVAASATTGLSDLKETTFGLQLLSLLRLHTFPEYIP